MDYQFEKDIIEKGFKSFMSKPGKNPGLTDSELQEINKKAYAKALSGFLETAYKREFVRQLAEDGTLPYIPKDPKMRTLLENQANAISTKPPYIFLTINPQSDVTLLQLSKVVKKLLRKKTISHYFFAYEVRKENEGLHCHILLEYRNVKPYDFKRGVKSTCKHICDSSNPHCLNFKFIDHDTLPSKIEYLLGDKKDKKLAGVKHSETYRKANNLQPYYESSPPFPCRATQTITDSPQVEEME